MRRCLAFAALVLVIASWPIPRTAAQQPSPQSPLGPAATQEEVRTYEAFRAWITSQPVDVQRADDDEVFKRYATVLTAQGKSEKEAAATIQLLRTLGDRAEVERWNRILTSPKARFSTAPNAFLVEMTKGLKPGRSLDVGMGQGRNTIFLAQQGWDSNGFDPADRAVAAAQEQAAKLGVKITTRVARAEGFDWGESQWDLIVLSYVGARDFVATVLRALRPGGMVVVEGFHRDATKEGPIGGAVVFDTNELLQLFAGLRVVRYEDTKAVGDFGLSETRVVRLAAVKP
jgi:SAM-dependent methyltransferase